MKRFISILLFLSTSLIFILPGYAQTEDSSNSLTIEKQIDELLTSLSSLEKTLKSQKITLRWAFCTNHPKDLLKVSTACS